MELVDPEADVEDGAVIDDVWYELLELWLDVCNPLWELLENPVDGAN